MTPRESPRQKPRDRTHRHDRRTQHGRSPRKSRAHATTSESSQPLSADSLAKLNQLNQHATREQEVTPKKSRQKRERAIVNEKIVIERSRKEHKRKKRRVVSGALLEEADGEKLRALRRHDKYEKDEDEEEADFLRRRKRLCMFPPVRLPGSED